MPRDACPTHPNGRHVWTFRKNIAETSLRSTALGTEGRSRLVGLYTCDCGARRSGVYNPNAPGADLRDHIELINDFPIHSG